MRKLLLGTLLALTACGGGTGPVDPGPPANVIMTLTAPQSVAVGGTVPVFATTSPSTPVTWISVTPSVATIAGPNVTGVAPGTATIRATAGSTSITATLNVFAPTFSDLVLGTYHACAPSASSTIYCWGNHGSGQLGLLTGSQTGCPGLPGQAGPIACSSSPVPLEASLQLVQVTAGGNHTCGRTAGGDAYCWGANEQHVLSASASETCSLSNLCVQAPLKVQGTTAFTWIGAGFEHFCGMAADGITRCWGQNGFGQVGAPVGDTCDGIPCARAPLPVPGGLAFQTITLGWFHTCALTPVGEAYCWGWNFYGQLGIGRTSAFDSGEFTPVPVSTALRFASISAGRDHTCAVTTGGAAYCWGLNTTGQLGDGSIAQSLIPRAVAGGHAFSSLTTGLEHTCALTPAGAAFCWGHNYREASTDFGGQLGDGTFETRLAPTAVAAAISFVQLDAGRATSCGRTAAGAVYCWGSNEHGIIGVGDRTTRSFTRPTGVGGIP